MADNVKRIKWKKSDFVKQAILLIFQFMVLACLVVATVFLTNGGLNGVKEFFNDEENIKMFVFACVITALLIITTFVYFYHVKSDFIHKASNVFMIYSILIISVIASYVFGKINIYFRPFSLCCLLILYVTDKRSAVFMSIIYASFMLVIDIFTYGLIDIPIICALMSIVTGIIAIFLIDGKGSRLKVLSMGVIISLPVIIMALCLEVSNEVSNTLHCVLFALGSGILADSLFIVILPIIEVLFGAITDFRLSELTDHKVKLIKNLMLTAPGTFNHTILVASLSEACGNAIGENPLLARACAYYHDVGKLKNPEYFAENQVDGNPHDDLLPELSTDIIKAHARDGAELIRKRRLPTVLSDAAEQHHGTLPIKYFYAKAKKFTDGDLDIEDFCYAGPKPQTKINAIIMICDASEAKVRTISNRTHENVDKAVREIIEERIELEQFTECDITLRELDIIRHTITDTLAGVYHGRVKYPKLKVGGKNAN